MKIKKERKKKTKRKKMSRGYAYVRRKPCLLDSQHLKTRKKVPLKRPNISPKQSMILGHVGRLLRHCFTADEHVSNIFFPAGTRMKQANGSGKSIGDCFLFHRLLYNRNRATCMRACPDRL